MEDGLIAVCETYQPPAAATGRFANQILLLLRFCLFVGNSRVHFSHANASTRCPCRPLLPSRCRRQSRARDGPPPPVVRLSCHTTSAQPTTTSHSGRAEARDCYANHPIRAQKVRRHWVENRSASLPTDVSLEVACHRANWLSCQAANA